MSGTSIRVPPLSRAHIRALAKFIHDKTTKDPPFPIVEFVEFVLPTMVDGFSFGVLTAEEMGAEEHGRTYPASKQIFLREDIYERAVAGHGRDRFTLAHEVGHLFLHNTGLHREMPRSEVRKFEDSEWQANCFAGELLMPIGLVRAAASPEDLSKTCAVSLDAACFTWRFVRDRN